MHSKVLWFGDLDNRGNNKLAPEWLREMVIEDCVRATANMKGEDKVLTATLYLFVQHKYYTLSNGHTFEGGWENDSME